MNIMLTPGPQTRFEDYLVARIRDLEREITEREGALSEATSLLTFYRQLAKEGRS